MNILTSSCPLCNGNSVVIAYNGPIRSGSFGRKTDRDYRVLRCSHCEVMFLDPFPVIDYSSGEYRQNYNDSMEISDYYRLHDGEQLKYLSSLVNVPLRGKIIADFGCGGGSFLDHVQGLAKKTVAVEPFVGYHQTLMQKGHKVYRDVAEILNDASRQEIDIAISIHVIEHVSNPVGYLNAIGRTLNRDGLLFVATPNSSEIMMKIDLHEYKPFFYRTSHFWYFNDISLQMAAKKADLIIENIFFKHNYDLSNLLCWLKDRRPTGVGKMDLLDERMNSAWKTFVEGKGMADTVCVLLKPGKNIHES